MKLSNLVEYLRHEETGRSPLVTRASLKQNRLTKSTSLLPTSSSASSTSKDTNASASGKQRTPTPLYSNRFAAEYEKQASRRIYGQQMYLRTLNQHDEALPMDPSNSDLVPPPTLNDQGSPLGHLSAESLPYALRRTPSYFARKNRWKMKRNHLPFSYGPPSSPVKRHRCRKPFPKS